MPDTSHAPPAGRLWNRNFLLLWQGQAVSQIGNQAFAVAMLYWTLKATGSASLMGLLLAVSALPAILLSPLGGAFADRFGRVRILLCADLLSGAAMLALALAMLVTGSPRLLLPMLVGVSVLLGAVRAFFQPALLAAIPDLVPAGRLEAANAVHQLAGQGSLLLGQGLGGVLYTLFGAPLLFLGDAVSFLLSAGCTAFIRLPTRPAAPTPDALGGQSALHRFRAEILDGLRYARSTPGFLAFLLAAAGFNFFLMPILVLLPIYVERYLHAGPEWYGFLLAAVSGGSLLGFVASGLLRLEGRARGRWVTGLMLLAPTSFLAIGLVANRLAAFLASVLLGIMLAIINVQLLSILQATTPPELRGRILSLLTTVSSGLAPIGMALGGVAGDLTGKNIPLVYALCSLLAVLFELTLMLRRSVYAFLSSPSPREFAIEDPKPASYGA